MLVLLLSIWLRLLTNYNTRIDDAPRVDAEAVDQRVEQRPLSSDSMGGERVSLSTFIMYVLVCVCIATDGVDTLFPLH